MTDLVIDDTAIAQINEVRKFAESNPYTLEQMRERMTGNLGAPGDDPRYVVNVDPDIRCVYSIETNEERMTIRTLSVGIQDDADLVHPSEVEMLLPFFGFANNDIAKATESGAMIVLPDILSGTNAVVLYERMLH